jgi:hypothetical protein
LAGTRRSEGRPVDEHGVVKYRLRRYRLLAISRSICFDAGRNLCARMTARRAIKSGAESWKHRYRLAQAVQPDCINFNSIFIFGNHRCRRPGYLREMLRI